MSNNNLKLHPDKYPSSNVFHYREKNHIQIHKNSCIRTSYSILHMFLKGFKPKYNCTYLKKNK